MSKTPPKISGKNSSMFIYLSLLLIIIAVLFFIFGPRLVTKAPSAVNNEKQPFIERATITSNSTFINSLQEDEVLNLKPTNNTLKARLFFINPASDGLFNLKSSVTSVNTQGKTPLEATMMTLMGGASLVQQNQNLYSMIPEGSKLLEVTVQDGTAFLNFNENFRFNSFGLDGYNAQLAQVVYTATEFSNVQRVKILIEGQEVDFLSEGVDVSQPLERNLSPSQ